MAMTMGDGGGAGVRNMGAPQGEMDLLLLGKTRELVAATPSQRNWKGILIALLVICGVCGLILFSIYLVRPPDDGPRVKGRKVTLEDITNKHFTVEPFNGSWISENQLLFRDQLGGLSELNADTLIIKPFVANTTFRQLNTNKFAVSADLQYILFIHDIRPVRKYSFLAKYTLYDIKNEFTIPLTPHSESNRDLEQPELQYATWLKDGNALIFVYKNDIYYKPIARASRVLRITSTGTEGLVFNGIPDFLYEEEIFGSNSAIWTTGDGQHLLYATFNDSNVGESTYPFYGDNLPYPRITTLRYPKAGTNNPVVNLWVVNLKSVSLQSFLISPPISILIKDHYLTGIEWINNEMFVAIWMNRLQNLSVLNLCKMVGSRWKCEEIYTLRNSGEGWLDFVDPPLFSDDAKSCIMRIPWRDGEAGQFRHIIWLDIASRKEIPITHGPFEVTKIAAWDQKTNLIYFLAAPKGKPGQRHLYQTSQNSSNSTVITAPECLTCPSDPPPPSKDNETVEIINPEEWIPGSGGVIGHSIPTPLKLVQEPNITEKMSKARERDKDKKDKAELFFWNTARPTKKVRRPCLYVNVIFSPKSRFFVKECLGPDVPVYTLHQSGASGRFLMMLDNNSALQEEIDEIGTPIVRNFQVNVTGGYHAPVRLTLPPGLLEEEEFKFPLILKVNGAPGSQLVSEKWEFPWASYLSSEKNFIVAEIDGRGTGYQGEAVRHAVFRKLGTQEVADQLEAISYLRDNLHFIDEDNMAVWGSGFGGFLVIRILAEESKLFRCGIAISPVSKWEFYNSAYTERYMGMPNFTDNYRGYEESDVTRLVDKLHEKNLLIIHGTADDSYQHSLYLTKGLIRTGVAFTEQIYPDEGSRLEGVQAHLYSYMYSFIEKNFDPLDFGDYEKANFLGIRL